MKLAVQLIGDVTKTGAIVQHVNEYSILLQQIVHILKNIPNILACQLGFLVMHAAATSQRQITRHHSSVY